MPVMNAPESVTRRRSQASATDVVVAPVASAAPPRSATSTEQRERQLNASLAVGALSAADENEAYAEQAISLLGEVLEPYDE